MTATRPPRSERAARWTRPAAWGASAIGFALAPKCVLCLWAYVAALTGAGVVLCGGPAEPHVSPLLTLVLPAALSIGALIYAQRAATTSIPST